MALRKPHLWLLAALLIYLFYFLPLAAINMYCLGIQQGLNSNFPYPPGILRGILPHAVISVAPRPAIGASATNAQKIGLLALEPPGLIVVGLGNPRRPRVG